MLHESHDYFVARRQHSMRDKKELNSEHSYAQKLPH